MNRFSIRSDQVNGETVYFVAGSIENEQQFERISAENRPKVVVDLKDVSFISSNGIRSFFKWLGKFPEGCQVTFRNIPYVIARQIGSLQEFLPQDYYIESIAVPYICVECDGAEDVIFRDGVEFRSAQAAGGPAVIGRELTCPNCGKPMEMDVVASSYFWFLKPARNAS